MTPTEEQDREEILRIHREWWMANVDLDIPRMQACFPAGRSFVMFNANGHTYFGIDELTTLWRWYQKEIDLGLMDVKIIRFELHGDMAWLATEGLYPTKAVGAAGTGSVTWDISGDKDDEGYFPSYARATEIYQRDDGNGNRVWRMWHYHDSPLPPLDEPRPSVGDTLRERGIGGNPMGEPLQIVGRNL